jgi:thioredoxin reductase (NADPH)
MAQDTIVTLLVTFVLVVGLVLPYFLKVRKKEREARRQFERARISGLQTAISMHPQIDALACIGCGSCVKACPEHDVLGVIAGKAVLVHGAKCVGHGLCAEACPVGAITMMMASPGRSANLPVLSEHYETTVANLFIIGELGGMGLIRNAMTQGRDVVAHIASRDKDGDRVLDVAIVGAGPAGIAAGLAAKMHDLRYVVLEQGDIGGTILQYPRRKVVLTAPVEVPMWGRLNLRETAKEDLLKAWEEILAKTGLAVNTYEKVTAVRRQDRCFLLSTPKASYEARHVVLALGRRGTPKKLGVPGEELGKVMYRLIDADNYQDCDIMVVGGGDSAVEAALGLALQGTNRVILSYRKAEFTRLKSRNEKHLQEAVKQRRLKVMFNSNVLQIFPSEVMIETEQRTGHIRNDYVFVFAGGEMPFEFLKGIGIQFHAQSLPDP